MLSLEVLFGSDSASPVMEREASYRKDHTADQEGAETNRKKDYLTLGLFLLCLTTLSIQWFEFKVYVKSARGDMEIGVRQAKGVSCQAFHCFRGVRRSAVRDVFCHRSYFAPIPQRPAESSFLSKCDKCARKTIFSELDEVGPEQDISARSRRMSAVNPTT